MHRLCVPLDARLKGAALGLGLALLVAGCGGQPATGVAAQVPAATAAPTATAAPPVVTTAITIKNFAFGPQAITVPVGSTVTWTNDDIEQHTATARDKTFDSDVINGGKTFSFTFSKAGTYAYSCLIHPEMVGTVIVTPK